MIALLAISVVVAVGRGYRRVSEQLRAQRRDVELAELRYSLVRDLDARLAPIARSVDDGVSARDVLSALAAVLHGLHPSLRWSLPALSAVPAGVVRVELVPEELGLLTQDDLQVLVGRARNVLDAVRRRDHVLLSLEAERRSDPMTGLANRHGFTEAVERAMREHSGRMITIILADIDHFGDINGALGFAGADRVLDRRRRPPPRSRCRLYPGATVARIAADEFGIVLPFDGAPEDSLVGPRRHARSSAMLEASRPQSPRASASRLGRTRRSTGPKLLRRAAVAILLAKQGDERAGFVAFDPLQHAELSSSLDDELAVRNALRAGELVMHYQPIVQLESGAPLGCEALVRWDRPGVGLVGSWRVPADHRAQRVRRRVRSRGPDLGPPAWSDGLRSAFAGCPAAGPYVSVNIDAPQLRADPGFEAFIDVDAAAHRRRAARSRARTHRARGGRRGAPGDADAPPQVRRAHRDRRLRFRVLLARTEHAAATRSPQARPLVRAVLRGDAREQQLFTDIAGMGRTLGLELTAEGIETEDVAATLRSAGIRHGQGFLYSPAVPETQLTSWLRARLGSMRLLGGL
jgi:diguanylate cyclase (GGDEF)-like protein